MQKGFESLAFIFALPHGDPLYEEFENSIQPPIIAFKKLILKLLLKLFRPSRLLIAFSYAGTTFCKPSLQNTTSSATSLMLQSYRRRGSLSL